MTENPYVTLFFGEPWDAPQLDNARQVDTPLGQPCSMCSENIQDGDQGILVPHIEPAPEDHPDQAFHSTVRPVHRECQLADIFSHQMGFCWERAPGLTPRQRGRLTLKTMIEQRWVRD